MTLKFDGWPRKIIGHLFYITSNFVHHLKSIGEFKLELLSGNTQFRSKSVIFLSRVTLKFDGWHWKTIGHLLYVASSFVYHFIAIYEFKLKLQPGNAQFRSKSAIFVPYGVKIWWMTLKNNWAPLLCCFKLCASVDSHRWIRSKVILEVEYTRKIAISISDIDRRSNLNIDRDKSILKFDFFCDLVTSSMTSWIYIHRIVMIISWYLCTGSLMMISLLVFLVIMKNGISFIKEYRGLTLRPPCDVIVDIIIMKILFCKFVTIFS